MPRKYVSRKRPITLAGTKPAEAPQENPNAWLGFEVKRTLPDGRQEIQFPNGNVEWVHFSSCSECDREYPAHIFNDKLCCFCFSAAAAREKRERVDSALRERMLRFGEDFGKDCRYRYNKLLSFAKVRWRRDRAKIRELYDRASKLTRETGIPHEVDHIYPIQGRNGCGLHVHWNLQVITRQENRAKSNGVSCEQPLAIGHHPCYNSL